MLSFAGRVGKAIAKIVPVEENGQTVSKLVVDFSVAMNTWVRDKEITTWVWMSVWEAKAAAFIEHRPSFIIAHGELYAEQYENDGVPRTQLKLHQPKITWGPKDGNNCEIDDRRTSVATVSTPQAPATADIGSIAAAVAQVLAQASAPAPATPAAEAPVEINFDEDPFD